MAWRKISRPCKWSASSLHTHWFMFPTNYFPAVQILKLLGGWWKKLRKWQMNQPSHKDNSRLNNSLNSLISSIWLFWWICMRFREYISIVFVQIILLDSTLCVSYRPFVNQRADISLAIYLAIDSVASFRRYNLVLVKFKNISMQSRYIDYRIANRSKLIDKDIHSAPPPPTSSSFRGD